MLGEQKGCLLCEVLCLAKNCYQVGWSRHVHCHDGISIHWISSFIAVYDALHHRDI
jgi:hypothetical protein